ncbi:MAG TPA: rhomboid family intramembrane serine protease [Vicinamibacterales bacterium]|nr:rhomboid family intramembrane serine protease [Vicinamibacterales bacterium]
MPTPLFALFVLAAAAIYFMTPEERTRLLRACIAALKNAAHAATHPAKPDDPFIDLLRTRTRWVVVTPLLVVVHVLVFMQMASAPGAISDPQTAIEWGANFAPRTTNNEWQRLIVSTFLHAGLLHLLATIAGLLLLGFVLERIVGRVTFAAIYAASGLAASVVSLWTTTPTAITLGPSGAIFGVYGLLLASLVWTIVERPPVPIPLPVVKACAAAAVPFFLYNGLTDHLSSTAELAGCATGLIGGLLTVRGLTREKPPLTRTAVLAAATAAVAIAAALPLRGITDFRPHIAQIASLEERTTTTYDQAVSEFRLGRLSAKRLAQLIDRTILPDLQGVKKRLSEVRGVPREQQPLVDAADAYLKLREQSWRRRADALLRSNLGMLREAERTERSALEAFQKIGSLSAAGAT